MKTITNMVNNNNTGSSTLSGSLSEIEIKRQKIEDAIFSTYKYPRSYILLIKKI